MVSPSNSFLIFKSILKGFKILFTFHVAVEAMLRENFSDSMKCPWRWPYRQRVQMSAWHQHPGLSIVPGAPKGSCWANKKSTCSHVSREREEKSQPSNISMQASVSLTAF